MPSFALKFCALALISASTLGISLSATAQDFSAKPITLVVGFPAGIPKSPLNLALLKGCQIVGVFWGSFTDREVAENQRNNEELIAFYTAGKIRPHVSAKFALKDAGTAIRALSERRALGKLVVTID
jgi:NADPH2:quinone reductase